MNDDVVKSRLEAISQDVEDINPREGGRWELEINIKGKREEGRRGGDSKGRLSKIQLNTAQEND